MADTIQCPGCRKQYPANPKLLGRNVRCKSCGQVFLASGATDSEVPVAKLAEPEPPVPVAKLAEPAGRAASPPGRAVAAWGATSPASAPALGVPEAAGAWDSATTLPRKPKPRRSVGGKNLAKRGLAFLKQYGRAMGALVGVVLVAMLLWFLGSALFSSMGGYTADGPPEPLSAADLPERGPMRPLAPGVQFCEVELGVSNSRPGYCDTLYVYLPAGDHSPGSLPCVLIASAGSNLITGMVLGEADRDEHIPYVKAGFAVMAYELDGPLANPDQTTIWQLRRAVKRYLAAQCGLVNAKNALEYISAKVPEIDPNRIYTAGHSSAATTALLLAEHEPRIHGCVAYAPVANLPNRFRDGRADLRDEALQSDEIIDQWSPHQFVDQMNCPVLLFHARDDSVVPCRESTAFAKLLRQHDKIVKLELVASGDHYDSMIYQGIPKGIAWLSKIDGGVEPATTSPEIAGETPDMQPMSWGIPLPTRPKGREVVEKMCAKHGPEKMIVVEMTGLMNRREIESARVDLQHMLSAAGATEVYISPGSTNIRIWAAPITDLKRLHNSITLGQVVMSASERHRYVKLTKDLTRAGGKGVGNTGWPGKSTRPPGWPGQWPPGIDRPPVPQPPGFTPLSPFPGGGHHPPSPLQPGMRPPGSPR